MEVALTFGSLGDIIQLCQLAIQLGRAVGLGCRAVGESAREYQDLRNDLDTFVHVLMQVVATYQQHELSPYLQGLDNVSRSVVNQSASLIQDTLDHIHSRYGKSLGIEGSGNKIKDIYKRIEWSVKEKEILQHLRNKLQEGVQRLSLLTSLAAEKSARVDNATVLARIDQVQILASEARTGQEDLLKFIQDQRAASEKQAETQLRKFNEVNKQLITQEQGTQSILAVAKDAFSSILELKNLLIQVSQNVVNLQAAPHSMFTRPLDPTKGVPVILEDALGRPLEIPAQWIDTLEWEVLNGLLKGYFKGHKGHDMVLREEFVLEESASGRDLNTELPLHQCLRRGMKINMSMVFESIDTVVGVCPRCQTETDAPEDVSVRCPVTDCGMWFRMQKQVIASSVSDEDQTSGETLVGYEATVVTSIPVGPGDFQRVRLLRPYEVLSQSDVSVTDTELDFTFTSNDLKEDASVPTPQQHSAWVPQFTNPASSMHVLLPEEAPAVIPAGPLSASGDLTPPQRMESHPSPESQPRPVSRTASRSSLGNEGVSIRFSPLQFQYDEGKEKFPDKTFQVTTNTFKNSVWNRAHFGNPDFVPEEWSPEDENLVRRF